MDFTPPGLREFRVYTLAAAHPKAAATFELYIIFGTAAI
jgi:hypothetical protein